MGDVLDAVSARIKAPYFGYAVLAFVAWNWRGIFLLVMTAGSAEQRLAVFDLHTNVWSLYVAPLITGVVVAASSEWIRFIFEWVARNPRLWMEMNHQQAEHKKVIQKIELERLRDERFTRREEELIARAQRDEKVKEIADDEVKRQLQSELDELRRERERGSVTKTESSLPSPAAHTLLQAAEKSDGRIVRGVDEFGRYIGSGDLMVVKSLDPRDYSRHEAALRELEDSGLVVQEYEDVYEVTEKGWQCLEFLEAQE